MIEARPSHSKGSLLLTPPLPVSKSSWKGSSTQARSTSLDWLLWHPSLIEAFEAPFNLTIPCRNVGDEA